VLHDILKNACQSWITSCSRIAPGNANECRNTPFPQVLVFDVNLFIYIFAIKLFI